MELFYLYHTEFISFKWDTPYRVYALLIFLFSCIPLELPINLTHLPSVYAPLSLERTVPALSDNANLPFLSIPLQRLATFLAATGLPICPP